MYRAFSIVFIFCGVLVFAKNNKYVCNGCKANVCPYPGLSLSHANDSVPVKKCSINPNDTVDRLGDPKLIEIHPWNNPNIYVLLDSTN